MTVPRVPDEHYLWLGRISASFGQLDLQLGMLGYAVKEGKAWTEDWTKVSAKPGMAVRLCREAVAKLPEELAERTRILLEAAEPLRLERHRLSHSVFILDPETDAESAPWVLKDPKGTEFPLLTEQHGADIVRSINRLSREASLIRAALRGAL